MNLSDVQSHQPITNPTPLQDHLLISFFASVTECSVRLLQGRKTYGLSNEGIDTIHPRIDPRPHCRLKTT